MENETSIAPPHRNHAIDGLRGFAALSVAFFHGLLHFDTDAFHRVFFPRIVDIPNAHDMWLKVLLSIFNGESAVLIFFVLSGLVLSRSLERLNGVPEFTAVFDFTIKRLLRIYPAVIACMAFLFILTLFPKYLGLQIFPPYPVPPILKGAALIDVGVHGPMWTLQVELCAIPFFLITYLLRRWLGTYVIGFAFIYAFSALEFPVLAWNYSLLAGSLFTFATGMIIGMPGMDRVFRDCGKSASVAALLFFLGVRQVLGHSSNAAMLTQVAAAGLLIAVLFYSESPMSRFLSSSFPRFLGRISYSFYLFNVLILGIIWSILDAYVPASHVYTITAGLFSAVVGSAVAIPLSVLTERYVEQPGIALGRAIVNWTVRLRRPAV